MTPLNWPANVPMSVRREGYTFTPGGILEESEMERGHKLRPVSTGAPELHKVPIRMNWEQLHVFQNWLETENPMGSKAFWFQHPLLKTLVRAQIKPQDKRPYTMKQIAGRQWEVTLELRLYKI